MRIKLDYNIEWEKYIELTNDHPSGIKIKIGEKDRKVTKSGKSQNKYWRIWFNSNHYAVHRIIWVMTNGFLDPNLVIDHIDGDSLNNELKNLRAVSYKINSRNRKLVSSNVTGISSITHIRLSNRSGGYNDYIRVSLKLESKTLVRSFNIAKYGLEKAKELALDFYLQNKHLRLADGYTERANNELRSD